MRTITVKGTGNVSIPPDRIKIDITAKGNNKIYGAAVSESAKYTKYLKEVVGKAGIDPGELKTTQLSVHPSYRNYQDKRGNWKQDFNGYNFVLILSLVFPNDNDLLGKLLYELAEFGRGITFSITYTVSDEESIKDELLHNAIGDAVKKAGVLTAAAGVKLKEIVNIDYSWGRLIFESQPFKTSFARSGNFVGECMNQINIDIDADDIKMNDSVSVTWEIE